MTPLEQTFWCERFNAYMHDFAEHSGIVEHKKAMRESCKLADLDLAEFRKRFGDSQVRSHDVLPDGRIANYLVDKLGTSTAALYPWELLPEWVTDCATDKDGESCGYNHPPVIDIDFEDEWMYGEEFNDYNHMTFKDLGLENVPVPDWRLSLEKRPGGVR